MSRHQTRRRRLYGRRLHDLRERRERLTMTDGDGHVVYLELDEARLAASDVPRLAIKVHDDRGSEGLTGLPLGFAALD